MKEQFLHGSEVFPFSLGHFSPSKNGLSVTGRCFMYEKLHFSYQLSQLSCKRWIKSESISITWGLYFILTNHVALQFCRLNIGTGGMTSDFTASYTCS